MKRLETKSPIVEKSLRYPAQSLDEKIDNLITEKAIIYIGAPSIFLASAINAWVYSFSERIPNPIVMTIITLFVFIWSGIKFYKLRNESRALRQGRDGEREVGMNLELLREQGLKVYHDILGTNFNLDHILVGEQGIFVVETKTYSKPNEGTCKIIYDGEKLSYNGTYRSDKPIVQAKASAQWLKNYLKDSIGKNFNVHPIVVFPGWFTESKVPLKDIWILNPKGLNKFMQNARNILSKDDVALITNRIEIYVRNTDYT